MELLLGVYAFVLGTVFGSFGSVLVTRIPEGEWIGGRSHCPRCGRMLGVIDLLPIVSFLVLRAKCRTCRTRISWLYPFLEGASGLLFVLALRTEPTAMISALLLALTLWLFFLLTVTDARTGFVSDYLTVPFVGLSLLHALMTPASPFFLAPLIGGGFFAAQWLVSRGRWVGSGDILVGLGMGFLLGDWRSIMLALFLSYIVGSVVSLALIAGRRRSARDRIPFIPFLFMGTLLTVLFGAEILRLYLP